jgi:hypothetical protein
VKIVSEKALQQAFIKAALAKTKVVNGHSLWRSAAMQTKYFTKTRVPEYYA